MALICQPTKTSVAVNTGWKFAFWTTIGEAVAYLSQNIGVLHLPTKYAGLVPFIGMALAMVGKMIASFLATENPT